MSWVKSKKVWSLYVPTPADPLGQVAAASIWPLQTGGYHCRVGDEWIDVATVKGAKELIEATLRLKGVL